MMLLRRSHHLPILRGFCGDLFALESIPNMPLFTSFDGSMRSRFFVAWDRLWFPDWYQRGKIAVGLIELVSDLNDRADDDGVVHLCDAVETAFGYSKTGDLKVVALSILHPLHELQKQFDRKVCFTENDCRFSNYCSFACSKENYCSTVIVQPNLYHVCRLVAEYLRPGVDRKVWANLSVLLDRCDKLNSTIGHSAMEESLLINDLKSFLWRHISHRVS